MTPAQTTRLAPATPARYTTRVQRIGIDTGGTFTDVAVLRRRGVDVHKLPSTPADPASAVLRGLAAVRGHAAVDVVHGTTVALNAVLTGSLAKTALVTNCGFEDLIEIARQERSGIYDLTASKPAPVVPRSLRFGIASRRRADGTVTAKPTARELRALREKLARAGVEAVAVGLLHSFAHPEDEQVVARALAPLGVPICCSAELTPVAGEYERYSTAILNAAVTPVIARYLEGLAAGVAPGRLRLMRSSSGIMSTAEATVMPARAMMSGPAGGVLATRRLARKLDIEVAAAFDMGGTSTDVCLVTPEHAAHDRGSINGLPLAVPAVDVHTIGCGGGSLATIDSGGALRVGPESAGADPGPACYGRGSDPTVTDAHMVLGHMGPETLLGGGFPVDPDLSVRAVERLGRRLGLDLRRTALGILEVSEVAMMRALLVITVARAIDPAGVPLVAYGGAGGLHACSLARRLSMPRAIVPVAPGAFSAVGLALAAESFEETQPIGRDLDSLTARQLSQLAHHLGTRARRALGRGRATQTQVDALLRYRGQGESVRVPFAADMAAALHRRHQQLYGFTPTNAAIELVDLRARAERAAPSWPSADARSNERRHGALPATSRRAPAGSRRWRVYQRADLPAGTKLRGPCLVEEATGVTVVPAACECSVTPLALILL